MKTILSKRIWIILLILPFLTSFAQIGDSRSIPQDQLSTFIQNSMEVYHISGLSASVVVDGEVAWKGNFGMANIEKGIPVSDSTIFLLYSLSKPFTGAALMQLVEDGLLDLDAPVNDYLSFEVVHPDYPDSTITTRMLMGHVSGIHDNWSVINSLYVYGEDTPVPLDTFLLNYLTPGGTWYNSNSSFTNHKPGTYFDYSNVGASLVGLLVESVSGTSFNQYCQENLFAGLQMPQSSFYMADLDTGRLAMPYGFNGTGFIPAGHISNPVLPAGFLRTSRNQLDHFLMCMLDHGSYEGISILDSTTVEEMTTLQYPAIESTTGLLMGYDPGNDVWGHTGGLNGIVKTAMFFNKEENWGINLLTNGEGDIWQIVFMLYQYAREYTALSAVNLMTVDEDQDEIINQGETVDLSCGIRNNFLYSYSGITARLSTSDPDVEIMVENFEINQIQSGDTVENVSEPFSFRVSETMEPHQAVFYLDFFQGSQWIGCDSLDIYLGRAHLLLVDDETSLFRNMVHTTDFYLNALEPIDIRVNSLDLNKWKLPSLQYLSNQDALVWFTGLTRGNVLSEAERTLLAGYLDDHGKLFITGQNIPDDTLSAEFITTYLHANNKGEWTGAKRINGVEGNVICEGMNFWIEGGTGSGSQVSPNQVEPINGGEDALYYASDTSAVAAVSYTGDYKTIFLGFGFEGIAQQADRDTLMQRIIRWFGPFTGKEEEYSCANPSLLQIKIYPNPVIDQLHIALSGKYTEPATLRIIDLSGRIMAKQTWQDPSFPAIMDIGLIPGGIYLLTVTGEGLVLQTKLIK